MTSKQRDKLIKALALLESNYDGEVIGAAKAIVRIVKDAGKTFDDVIITVIGSGYSTESYVDEIRTAYENIWSDSARAREDFEERVKRATYGQHTRERFQRSNWHQIALEIDRRYRINLTDWEVGFIISLARRMPGSITANQWKVLLRIAKKLEARHGY